MISRAKWSSLGSITLWKKESGAGGEQGRLSHQRRLGTCRRDLRKLRPLRRSQQTLPRYSLISSPLICFVSRIFRINSVSRSSRATYIVPTTVDTPPSIAASGISTALIPPNSSSFSLSIGSYSLRICSITPLSRPKRWFQI